MTNAILLHGKPGKDEYYDVNQPSASNAHWFPWLQNQLLARDIKADTPEVPLAFDRQWDLWVREVERFEIGSDTTLVEHSCGGGFWLRNLNEHQELRVGKVILVAPSLGLARGDGGEHFTEDTPEKAYEYVVNGKGAVEWIMDRHQVTKHKDSGITNDPNDWAKEASNPRYILDLLLSVINVNIQTVDIVNNLPKLTFEAEKSA